MRRTSVLLGGCLALGLALAACGGSSDGGAYVPPKGPVVDSVTVDSGNLYFKPDRITTEAGNVRITLDNVETGAHNLVIEGVARFILEVSGEGDSDTNVVALETGDYVFYCSLPGHRSGGMEGEITVG
ncbi:MAG: plastocyanin/azurin family copper-binding protein [Actinomycetes bacterium]